MDYLAFCGKTFDDSDESDETSEADDAYLESFLSKPDPDLKPPADKPDRTPKPPPRRIQMHIRNPPFSVSPGPDVYSLSFNEDGQFLAASYSDSEVRVFSVAKGTVAYRFQINAKRAPATMIRFRPDPEGKKNVVLVGGANGELQLWHVTSKRCIYKTVEICDTTQEPNAIYAADYQRNGKFLATAGMDTAVRVYDEVKHTVVQAFQTDEVQGIRGHGNRVFAVKWHDQDHNLLLSGGWDRTVRVWDMRVPESVKTIFGPYICGHSLDVRGNTVLAGTCTSEEQCNLYDLRSCNRLRILPLPIPDADIFSCEFVSNMPECAAISGSKGLACVMDTTTGHIVGEEKCATSAFCCSPHGGHHGTMVAFGCAGGYISCLAAQTKNPPFLT